MPLRQLQAGHSSLLQRKLESDAEIRCRKQPTPPDHPPARVPSRVADASCLGCLHGNGLDAGSTVAAKADADAPGGGISLCFCRRGCAAPAQKPSRSTKPAATLNDTRRSTRPKAATLNGQPQRKQTQKTVSLLTRADSWKSPEDAFPKGNMKNETTCKHIA